MLSETGLIQSVHLIYLHAKEHPLPPRKNPSIISLHFSATMIKISVVRICKLVLIPSKPMTIISMDRVGQKKTTNTHTVQHFTVNHLSLISGSLTPSHCPPKGSPKPVFHFDHHNQQPPTPATSLTTTTQWQDAAWTTFSPPSLSALPPAASPPASKCQLSLTATGLKNDNGHTTDYTTARLLSLPPHRSLHPTPSPPPCSTAANSPPVSSTQPALAGGRGECAGALKSYTNGMCGRPLGHRLVS